MGVVKHTPKPTIFETISLGALIDALKKTVNPQKEDKPVVFDFCGCKPTEVASYRGFYDHTAIGHTMSEDSDVRVADFARYLEGEIGKTMYGWKGGEYKIGRECPVWVDNRGECTETGIVGVLDCGWKTVIMTQHLES